MLPSTDRVRRKYKHATKAQAALLKEDFEKNNYVTANRLHSLEAKTGLSPRYIRIWFQNRRDRSKLTKRNNTMEIETQDEIDETMQTAVQQRPVCTDLEPSTTIVAQETLAHRAMPLAPLSDTFPTPAVANDDPDQSRITIPTAAPNYNDGVSRIAVPASFLPSLSLLLLDRVARAPLVHLARLENIPLESSWHHPDCPLLITCSNDLTWYSFDPKHLPDTLRPHEAPLKYLDMLGRYIHHPYPPIDKMTLMNLVLDDTLEPFKKVMGISLLLKLGIKLR